MTAKNRRRKKSRGNSLGRAIGMMLLILIVAAGFFVIKKYAPSKEWMDAKVYYELENEEQLAILVENEVIEEKGLVLDGRPYVPYKNVERVAGETKWNFWKLFKYSIEGIVNFSQAPLSIASMSGLFLTMVSFLMVLFVFVRRMIFGDPVAGWASTICIILFIGGVQLLCMGIMGQYLAKTYLEVKKRPHYIVAETNNSDVKRVK